ncbi:MAG: TetR family transcriptional regulator [Acidimicrobiales bacterium]
MEQEPADGRRARSERSRQAVIEALLALYEAGNVAPSVAEIATASGVSERSVFRHFADLEDLAAAAVDRKLAEVMAFFADPPHDGSLDGRIDAIVDQRLALHGRLVNLARAAAYHAVTSTTIAQVLADRRRLLWNQVGRTFAPELDPLPVDRRREVHALLDLALSLEALDYLHLGAPEALEGDALRAALRDQVAAALHLADRPDPTTPRR